MRDEEEGTETNNTPILSNLSFRDAPLISSLPPMAETVFNQPAGVLCYFVIHEYLPRRIALTNGAQILDSSHSGTSHVS